MLLKCSCGFCVLQVQTQLANHVAAVLPAILVGLACGVLGTIFTVLNVKVVRWRDAIIQVRPACATCTQDCSEVLSGRHNVHSMCAHKTA